MTTWLLIAVFVGVAADERQVVGEYRSRSECAAAAESFVAAHPAFDFHQEPEGAVIRPVLRSYVECVTQDEKRPD